VLPSLPDGVGLIGQGIEGQLFHGKVFGVVGKQGYAIVQRCGGDQDVTEV
jgi:hypothetical protein